MSSTGHWDGSVRWNHKVTKSTLQRGLWRLHLIWVLLSAHQNEHHHTFILEWDSFHIQIYQVLFVRRLHSISGNRCAIKCMFQLKMTLNLGQEWLCRTLCTWLLWRKLLVKKKKPLITCHSYLNLERSWAWWYLHVIPELCKSDRGGFQVQA